MQLPYKTTYHSSVHQNPPREDPTSRWCGREQLQENRLLFPMVRIAMGDPSLPPRDRSCHEVLMQMQPSTCEMRFACSPLSLFRKRVPVLFNLILVLISVVRAGIRGGWCDTSSEMPSCMVIPLRGAGPSYIYTYTPQSPEFKSFPTVYSSELGLEWNEG